MPQVACFDTSFHRSLPPVAKLVPLPWEIRGSELQRYGFHGLSYEYIASVLPQVAPGIARNNVIVAHLGNGASVCALKNGKSVDHSFGFTALDGLCMGTRPGAVDPGVILYLVQNLRLSPQEVETILYQKSGLLGISGTSSDMRDLLAKQGTGSASRGGLFCLPRGERDRRDVRCIERGLKRSSSLPVSAKIRRRSAGGSASPVHGSALNRPRRECPQGSEDLRARQQSIRVGHPDQRRTDDRPALRPAAGAGNVPFITDAVGREAENREMAT